MNLNQLTEADKGRRVAYRPRGQPHITETGVIKGWNSIYIWVVFTGPKPHWDSRVGERTAMACLPDTLELIDKWTPTP